MDPLDQFERDLERGDAATALEKLGEHLIGQGRFHELFELRKVQLRERLGLPVDQWRPIDDLPPESGRRLEEGLLDICREVGTRFFRAGHVAAGWSCLEPVGDKRLVRELLNGTPVTDENAEAVIHISIDQAIDPERGLDLVLQRFGTCAAITTCDSRLAGLAVEMRRGPVALLVDHVYRELTDNIRRSLDDAPGSDARRYEPGTLRQFRISRPDLTAGLGHHIDTTHLASTVRFSRILDQPHAIAQAIELAEYGLGLHSDFQYRGFPPFEKTYADTREFLGALAGGDAGPVIARLQGLAADPSRPGAGDAAAWLVYLLDFLGRGSDALEAWLSWLHTPEGPPEVTENIVPSLTGLVCRYGLYEEAANELRKRGDAVLVATILTARHQAAPGPGRASQAAGQVFRRGF